MKTTLLFLLLQFGLLGLAQHAYVPVDMKVIEDSLTNPTTGVDYGTLFKRFEALDTTLTSGEFRLIYYGYSFQQAYNGYPLVLSDEIRDLLKKERPKDYKKAAKICDGVLEDAPVNLEANLNKLVTMKLIDPADPDIKAFRFRYHGLVGAAIGSGDGLTCETGMRVMYVSDEYHLMYNYIGILESRRLRGRR